MNIFNIYLGLCIIVFFCILLSIRGTLYSINTSYDDRPLFVVVFIFYILFCAFRYRTGTDWPGYEEYFYRNDFSWEIGWSYFNLLVRYLDLNVAYVFFFTAVLSLFFKFVSISKFCKNRLLFAILMMPFLINKDFGTIRQGLAISICFFSTAYMVPRKIFVFTLLVFLASLIHVSALIFLAFYPVFHLFSWNKKRLLFIFLICILIGLSGLLKDLLMFLIEKGTSGRVAYKIEKYIFYSDEYKSLFGSGFFNFANIKKLVLFMLFYICGAFDNKLLQKAYYRVFALGTVIIYCLFFLFLELAPFRRLIGYFGLYELAFVCSYAYYSKELITKNLLVIFYLLLSLLSLYGYVKMYPFYLSDYHFFIEVFR